MTTKFISLATGIVTLDVYLQSQLHSSDPLFLVVSNNPAINMTMVVLATLAISVSFRKRFSNWYGYAATVALAAVLLIIGAGGMFLSNVLYMLPPAVLPLNYMLMLQSGVVLGMCALTYQHAPRPASVRLPSVALPPKIAFPVPKLSHTPLTGRFTVHGSS